MSNGKVLIAGGEDAKGYAVTRAEVYDPAAASFTLVGVQTRVLEISLCLHFWRWT
jgi:hypothetical protein